MRERAQNGSACAKKELQAIHKHNHQVVDRAEVAANQAREELDRRRQADASSHRKRSLARSLDIGTVEYEGDEGTGGLSESLFG